MTLFRIQSDSMSPALRVADVVWASSGKRLRRGSIIVFMNPETGKPSVKRVIGLSGDEVFVRRGMVFIDGVPLAQTRIADQTAIETHTDGISCRISTITGKASNAPLRIVPDGHVFVLGDDRGNSRDSRYFGPVPVTDIIGNVRMRVWPPRRFGRL